MKTVFLKIVKFTLIVPLLPAVALGIQYGYSWEWYFVVYLLSLGGLIIGFLLLWLLSKIFSC